jgi:RES domain-containing protein
MDPTEILNGRGTELHGGRFAPIGMKAVYLADCDSGASAEVLARKKRLGRASQVSAGDLCSGCCVERVIRLHNNWEIHPVLKMEY